MAILVLLLLLAILFGGVGAGLQLLWIVAIVGLIFWFAGFAFRSGESRWYRW